jgi:RND family efflux transporter MFP subunit
MRLLTLAVLLLTAACAQLGEPTPTPTPLPELGPTDRPLATARRGEIVETLRANGSVAPKQESTLYFARDGRLARLHAQIGRPVKKGDILAELDTGDVAARLERARLGLDVARLELQRAVENNETADPDLRAAAAKLALAHARRTQALAALAQAAADPSADRAPIERARSEAAVLLVTATDEYARAEQAVNTSPTKALAAPNGALQLAVKKAELAAVELDALEQQQAESRLVAPFDGIVTSAEGREGDTVKAFAPVAVVADPSELVVAMELAPADQAKVAVGQAATVAVDAFEGQSFPAKVLAAPGAAADNTKPEAAKVLVSLAAPVPVDLGSPASVTIVTREKAGVVLLPAGALRQEADRTYVQIVTPGGDLRESDVAIGIRTEGEVEITAGVKEGEQVVAAS